MRVAFSWLLLFATILCALPGRATASDLADKLATNPKSEGIVQRSIYDIERCLIMIEGPIPQVFRQPDRPDTAMIVWAYDYGNKTNFVVLKSVNGATEYRSSLTNGVLRSCLGNSILQ